MNKELSLLDYWKLCWTKNYANFDGRARRKEYWGFILFNLLIAIPLEIIVLSLPVITADYTLQLIILTLVILISLAGFVPSLAVSVRRLHDIGKSGWWILIGLIPFLGALILLYFYVLDGQPYDNQYGKNPKVNENI